MGILTFMGATILFAHGVHTFAEWINCRKLDNIKIKGLDRQES